MGIFSDRKLSASDKLAFELDENPIWPFVELPSGLLEYRVRYTRFYVGLAGMAVSCLALLIFFLVDLVDSSFFLWPAGFFFFFLYTALNYYHERVYTLDLDSLSYSFTVGDKLVWAGPFSNIYIRLRKRVDAGRTYHYLLLGGFRIDRQVLTGLDENVTALRRLGQQMALALSINYFDEPNVSEHHRVVHFKRRE